MSTLADGATTIQHRGFTLHILELADLANIAKTWQEKLRRDMVPVMDDLGLTAGQRLVAIRDFAMDPPGLQAVSRYCVTPEGIDMALRVALRGAECPDLSVLGKPFERYDLVGQLLQLEPGGGDIADPSSGAETTGQGSRTNAGDISTPPSPIPVPA